MDKLEQAKKTFEEGIKLFQKKNFKEAQIYSYLLHLLLFF